MDKIKLAICMQDLEYRMRFVNCLMNHYKHQYEVHVFTGVEELKNAKLQTYSAVISDEYTTDKLANFVEEGMKLLCLTEECGGDEENDTKSFVCTEKYQEVYKITEVIQKLTASGARMRTGRGLCKRTAIYSLSKENLQAPFTALLAELLGEKEKVLVLDLQPFSGFGENENTDSYMGLEDVLSMAISGNYSKERLIESIGHWINWDYIYTIKNAECLMEGNYELYEKILEILANELGYERIVINFGTVFPGWAETLEACDEIYLLTESLVSEGWRVRAFKKELERKNQGNLYQKVKRIEMPHVLIADDSWQTVLERWRYGHVREYLQAEIDKEHAYGEIM